MESPKNCIAKRLKQARLNFGISQKKLGILAGIDEYSASARMNQYEKGTHIPNFLTLQHIGKALGYPIAFFASENDLLAEIVYLTEQLVETDKYKVLNMIKQLLSHHRKSLK